jgi:type II secretory pathway component HofQ
LLKLFNSLVDGSTFRNLTKRRFPKKIADRIMHYIELALCRVAIIACMTFTQPNEIVERIEQDMHQAMKSRDRATTETLKSLLAQISNAEAVHSVDHINGGDTIAGATKGVGSSEAQRKVLTLSDLRSIILAEKQEIEAVIQQIDKNSEYAHALQEKLLLLEKYCRL